MSQFEEKFATFLNVMKTCQYDLPTELYDSMKQAMVTAGFDKIQVGGSTASEPTTRRKKLSGYNLYMKEKMAELKDQEVPSNERMGKVSKMWGGLGDDGKQEWKDKASALIPTTVTVSASGTKTKKTKKTGPKKLSGYQLFVKEKMPEMKANESIVPKERMGAIGAAWKLLTDDEKAVFKGKATTVNEEAAAEWDKTHSTE